MHPSAGKVSSDFTRGPSPVDGASHMRPAPLLWPGATNDDLSVQVTHRQQRSVTCFESPASKVRRWEVLADPRLKNAMNENGASLSSVPVSGLDFFTEEKLPQVYESASGARFATLLLETVDNEEGPRSSCVTAAVVRTIGRRTLLPQARPKPRHAAFPRGFSLRGGVVQGLSSFSFSFLLLRLSVNKDAV